jgi:hypothetical protein
MIKPKEKPVVKLVGTDGNAFSIMGKTINALRKAGADEEFIAQYKKEAISGNYNNVISTTIKYCEVI